MCRYLEGFVLLISIAQVLFYFVVVFVVVVVVKRSVHDFYASCVYFLRSWNQVDILC